MHLISFKLVVAVLLLALLATGLYNTFKPMPAGLAKASPLRPVYDVKLLSDVSWRGESGKHHQRQMIFPEIFRLINRARRLIVVDMFLFNDSNLDDTFEPLARQLADAIIKQKQKVPDLTVVVITDPLNTVYGGTRQPHFERLRNAGVILVETDLRRLRDSNPLWSALWRVCCQWFGNNPDGGWLPNVFGGGDVTLRSYLSLPNFKANHRKTLVVDEGDRLRGLITSANPHDGSSRHWNTAISFTGPAVMDLLETEAAVLTMSGVRPPRWPLADGFTAESGPDGGLEARVLTEAAIRDSVLAVIRSARENDRLDLAMFYLSHRGIVRELITARQRGVSVRVILDQSQDAFGRAKGGIPNRQVAMELHNQDIEVRWCNTAGEQCHNKLLLLRDKSGQARLLVGSANMTRRNLDNYNLETSLLLYGDAAETPMQTAAELFEHLWQNGPGSAPVFTLPYSANADESTFKYWRYRLMEVTGLSTF